MSRSPSTVLIRAATSNRPVANKEFDGMTWKVDPLHQPSRGPRSADAEIGGATPQGAAQAVAQTGSTSISQTFGLVSRLGTVLYLYEIPLGKCQDETANTLLCGPL